MVHLDDEALSAVLDGEAAGDEASHARTCASCSTRLERFRRMSVAVAAPVEPVAAERRRAMVASAVQEAAAPGGDAAEGDQTGEQTGDQGPPVGGGVVVLAERRLRRPRRPSQAVGWAVAAASVAVLAIAVPLLDRLPAGLSSQDSATSLTEQVTGAAGSVADECEDCGSVPGSAPGPVPVDGGDLGDLDRAGLDALAQRLAHGLSQPQGADESRQTTVDQSAQPESAPGGSTEQAARADARALPSDGDGPAPPAPTPTEAAGRCEAAARDRDPGLGPLAYTARARLDGVDAMVFAFAPTAAQTDPSRPVAVLVLAVDSCTQLAFASA